MPLPNSVVAATVRAELARAGVSGRQLGRELGWTPGFVHRRLSGEGTFRIDELGQVADFLGIPVATLVAEPTARHEPEAAAS